MSDRTEAPTPRRLRRARDEGDSGASGFASQALAFVAAVALAPAFAGAASQHAAALFTAALGRAVHPGGALRVDALGLALELAGLLSPLLLAVGLVAACAQVAQTGGVVTFGRLAPKLGRLDPVAGLAGLFSGARLWAVVRALVAGALVGWLAWRGLSLGLVDLAHLPGQPSLAPAAAAAVARSLAWQVALMGAGLGAVDLLVTRGTWLERLKMTRAEVQREHKDAEGDPALKSARARVHQEVLAQATLASVRKASVVVVNPTHLACALRYAEQEGDEAPVVVASGEGDFAARIVEAAREAGVPVVRDVPLARALVELEVGDVIPEVLYQAVAEILRELWEEGAR